jgi:FkbM family methyltransferase
VTTAARSLARRMLGRLGYDFLPAAELGYRLSDHLALLLRRLEVNLVLDVGARWGGFAAEIRAAGYRGHIVSFEPVTSSFELLSERAATDPYWTVQRLALGNEDGQLTINVTASSDLSSFRLVNVKGRQTWTDKSAVVGGETVDVRRLDSIFDTLANDHPQPRVFLKTDTQGWDLEVIGGAESHMSYVVGMMLEVHFQQMYEDVPGYIEELNALARLGYVPTGIFPILRDKSGAIVEADCVCVRQTSSKPGEF